MPTLALRSLWEAATIPVVVVTQRGGHDQDRRPRRNRVPLEQQLLALWAGGHITDRELERLLRGS